MKQPVKRKTLTIGDEKFKSQAAAKKYIRNRFDTMRSKYSITKDSPALINNGADFKLLADLFANCHEREKLANGHQVKAFTVAPNVKGYRVSVVFDDNTMAGISYLNCITGKASKSKK